VLDAAVLGGVSGLVLLLEQGGRLVLLEGEGGRQRLELGHCLRQQGGGRGTQRSKMLLCEMTCCLVQLIILSDLLRQQTMSLYFIILTRIGALWKGDINNSITLLEGDVLERIWVGPLLFPGTQTLSEVFFLNALFAPETSGKR